MNEQNVGTQIKELDLAGLKIYKKQNPAKFKHKFGDLDLDNLPEGFNQEDINRIRFLRTQTLPKPRLMTELELREYGAAKVEPTMEEVQAFLLKNGMTASIVEKEVVKEEVKQEVKEETEVEKEEEVTTTENGGTTLEETKSE